MTYDRNTNVGNWGDGRENGFREDGKRVYAVDSWWSGGRDGGKGSGGEERQK